MKWLVTIVMMVAIILPTEVQSQERIIKPGDALEILVFGNEQLSNVVTVNPDGTVDFPSMQGLPVDGITLQRFQSILTAQLSRYMAPSPLLSVKFAESYPIRVTILGQVLNPGLHNILNTSTIQGVVTTAGGFVPGAQLTQIKLIRNEQNGEISNQIINLEKFYLTGDPTYLPNLKDGDTIVVPGNPLATTVKVLGGVENPGSFQVSFQTSLLDVIFMAGGPTRDANLKGTQVLSFINQEVQKVNLDLDDLIESKKIANVPIVFPGDVIYIPKKIITWGRVMERLRDLTVVATLYFLIYRTQS